MENFWYKLKCFLYGHKHSCCGDIKKRCSHCYEVGRIFKMRQRLDFRNNSRWTQREIDLKKKEAKELYDLLNDDT